MEEEEPEAPAQPAAPVPSFAELEAMGARIGNIRIDAQDIFDLNDPHESGWFYRLVNYLHINSRTQVIQNILLFKSGEPVSARLMEESERLLRSYSFLYEASIRPIAYHDGVADVEVITRDTWSLDLGVGASRAGGSNSGHISLKEENLFGTGIKLGVAYSKDVDRSGTTFEIADPNIGGTRGTAAYSYSKNDDGNSQSFSLQRPFYELDARWAAGFSAGESDGLDALYNAGNSVAEYRHRRKAAETFGGWSPGLVRGWAHRYSIGLQYQEDSYALEPGHAPPERLPSDLTLTGPFVRAQFIEDAFRKDVNLNLIGRVEDFTMGVQANLQLGRALAAWGSTRDSWIYAASVGNGYDITKDSFILTSLSASGRYSDRGENEAVGVGARYYSRHGKHVVSYVAASYDAVNNPDVPGPLTIGGDNGLRGYPLRYQAGERRALMTLEVRGYTDWYPLRLFRVGGAVFYDHGRAWEGENQNTVNGGWLRDAGFGLRLLSARTSKGNVLHADFAFPLDPDPSIKRVQFLVKTKVSF